MKTRYRFFWDRRQHLWYIHEYDAHHDIWDYDLPRFMEFLPT